MDWIIQFNFRQNLIFLLKPYPTKLGADTGFFQGYDIIHNIYFFMDWIGLDWIGLDWIGLDWIGLFNILVDKIIFLLLKPYHTK